MGKKKMSSEYTVWTSLNLRDYFAGCALTGVVSGNWGDKYTGLAKDSYEIADAMLAERDNEETESGR